MIDIIIVGGVVLFVVIFIGSIIDTEYGIGDILYNRFVISHYKRKVDKDLYSYIRKLKLQKYFTHDTNPVEKTIIGIITERFIDLSTYISKLEYSEENVKKIEKIHKVFQYALYRLETSSEYKEFIARKKNDLLNKVSLEASIHEILKESLWFVNSVWKNTNLNFVDLSLKFNGEDLFEIIKENDNYTAEDIIERVIK